MFKNIIAEIIHATGKVKSPQGDFEKLDVNDIETNTLKVKDKASVNNELKVDHILKVDEKATIKELEVTDNVNIGKDATINQNLNVKKKSTFEDDISAKGLTTMKKTHIEAIEQSSESWGSDSEIRPLVTDVDEFKTGRGNKNSNDPDNGSYKGNPKFARVGHTHKIPNAIKNPEQIIIKNHSGSKQYAYDGSVKREFKINPEWTGSSPENHSTNASESNALRYGAATGSNYGHTKLYTAGSLIDSQGNINTTERDALKNMGADSSTALTPASLATYATDMSSYISAIVENVEQTFLKKPTEASVLTISGDVIFDGETYFKDRLRIGDSAYINGITGSTSDNTLQVYGVGDDSIGKIRFGKNPSSGGTGYNKTILTSANNGHLYVDTGNSNYISKLSDYEIEAVITSNSSKQYKVWYPAKEGYYRIYLIGGGGKGAAGLSMKDNGVAWSSDSNKGPYIGYGTGYAFGGCGGGGGPVVTIDLLTKSADATSPEAGDDIETISCDPGEITCSTSEITAVGSVIGIMPDEGRFNSKSATITVSIESIETTNLLFARNENSTDESVEKFTGAVLSDYTIEQMTLNDINISGLSPSKVTIDGAIMYIVEDEGKELTLSNVTLQVTGKLSAEGSSNAYYSFQITMSSIKISVTPYEEEDIDGVRFVFLNTTKKSIRSNLSVYPDGNNYPRCIGVQRLSSAGTVVDPYPDEKGPVSYSTLHNYGVNSIYGTDNTTSVKNTMFDAFAGHGKDYTTISGVKNVNNNTSIQTGRPYCHYVTQSGDGTVDRCIGGTNHMVGVDGHSYFGGEPVTKLTDQNVSNIRKNQSAWTAHDGVTYYSECDGYDGGPPGSIGITGVIGSKGTKGSSTIVTAKSYPYGSSTSITMVGGTGGSVAINNLDGYSLGVNHSDRSSASSQVRFPKVPGAGTAGIGYYGGGNGGGAAAVAASAFNGEYVSTNTIKKQSAQVNLKINEPCAIIVYLGKKYK